MYDEMWEDNTADLFEEITEEQALKQPVASHWGEIGLLTGMYNQIKLFERAAFLHSMSNFQPGSKPGTIKFRRYSNVEPEKTLVGGIECEAVDTLGIGRAQRRVLSRNISGSTNSKVEAAKKGMEKTPGSHGNGPALPEG